MIIHAVVLDTVDRLISSHAHIYNNYYNNIRKRLTSAYLHVTSELQFSYKNAKTYVINVNIVVVGSFDSSLL